IVEIPVISPSQTEIQLESRIIVVEQQKIREKNVFYAKDVFVAERATCSEIEVFEELEEQQQQEKGVGRKGGGGPGWYVSLEFLSVEGNHVQYNKHIYKM